MSAQRKRKPFSAAQLRWENPPVAYAEVRGRKRALVLARMHQRDRFLVVAVETSTTALNADKAGDPTQLFAEHAHAVVGRFKSYAASELGITRYVRRWLAGVELDRCDCETIPKRKRSAPAAPAAPSPDVGSAMP